MIKYLKYPLDSIPFVIEDWEGVRNLVSTLPQSLSRIILVSSVGVTKSNELPWRYDITITLTGLTVFDIY